VSRPFRLLARDVVKRVAPRAVRRWVRTAVERAARHRRQQSLVPPFSVTEGDVLLGIDESWSNDRAIGVRGWALGKTRPLDGLELNVAGARVPITAWHPRPDIAAGYQACRGDCGFAVQVPRRAAHRIAFTATKGGRTSHVPVRFIGSGPFPAVFTDASTLFNEFIGLVNEKHLRILEIGSRVVSPGSASKRTFFPGAASYTGFDYYPDANTDVVGDAHRLSEHFGTRQFDAVFSVSVLEHLAMPWVVAREINKILAVGGVTFHATVFAWPLHDSPWDFWRCSDEGLKVLFSRPVGFETVKAGLFHPARLHPDTLVEGQETLAMIAGYCGAAILAKKVAEVDRTRLAWKPTVQDVVGDDSRYPPPANGTDGRESPVSDVGGEIA